MKKLIYKLNFAIVGIMASSRVMAAGGAASSKGMEGICTLANEFGYIFNLMRTLAFIGAGISIAGWAWGYISGGKAVDITKEVKEKGFGMLLGFILLFSIGTVLQIFMQMAGEGGSLGCEVNIFK
ncbi:MAG: hypothetical protein E7006_03940 [Alphaproteobacteria bacterium]|nr:hypothetical protein [Alphaproteobacteria bacterium]